MDRGKTKKEKRYWSILFVPHYSGKVKTVKVSSFYKKLFVSLVFFVTVIACTTIFVITTIRENQNLRHNIKQLCSANIEQKELINTKAEEISSLKTSQKTTHDIINDFLKKYREMTDNYISSRIQTNLSSRSGDRTEHSFSQDIVELKNILKNLNEINNSEDKDFADLRETEQKLQSYLDSIPTLWPTEGRMSDGFGYRIHPIYKRRIMHEGVDIGGAYGQDILASASGKVTFSGRKGGYGNFVIIDHGYGISTAYGHASELLVKEGDTVTKGDVIAKVGSTGTSTGPHLHFEVRLNNVPVDPLNYLE